MNFYHRGKVEVRLNNNVIGYASSVSIDKNNSAGMKIVNVTVEGDSFDKSTNKVISEKENYDNFFQKFAKAFNKE